MENSKIGNIEAVLCVFIAIVVHTVLSLPKTLITNTKSAAILNTIYVTILALCFVYIVYKLFRYYGIFRWKDFKNYCWLYFHGLSYYKL